MRGRLGSVAPVAARARMAANVKALVCIMV